MTSIPEQLSAARTAQLEAQFALFRTLTTQALDNASKVVALNLSASRDSVERSSNAVRQLFSATNPSDLLELRSHAEEQFRSLFAYSRELFSIASSAQAYVVRPEVFGAATLAAPFSAPAPAADAASAAAEAVTAAAAPVERAVAEVTEPVAEAASRSVADTVSEAAQAVAEASEPAVEAVSSTVQAEAQAAAEAVEAVAEKAAEAAGAPADAPAAPVQEPVVAEEPVVAVEAVAAVDEPIPVARQKPVAKAAGKGVSKASVVPHPASAPVSASARAPKVDLASHKRKK
ncbi:phasin family protein [Massilia niastensis]|uniref:phasin family protein n=1 Tax=Massilia niastensis TaxID=544911 RepID=UPI0003A55F9E|nr:phasin family protein [Massilia niastensis]